MIPHPVARRRLRLPQRPATLPIRIPLLLRYMNSEHSSRCPSNASSCVFSRQAFSSIFAVFFWLLSRYLLAGTLFCVNLLRAPSPESDNPPAVRTSNLCTETDHLL